MAPRHGAPRQESAGVETAAGEADGFIIDWLAGPDVHWAATGIGLTGPSPRG